MSDHRKFAEELAHVTISAGMEKIFANEDCQYNDMSDGAQSVLSEVAKLNPDNTAAIIFMSVEKSTLPDGENGYAISGGICGTVEVLAGLMLVISARLEELNAQRPDGASVQ